MAFYMILDLYIRMQFFHGILHDFRPTHLDAVFFSSPWHFRPTHVAAVFFTALLTWISGRSFPHGIVDLNIWLQFFLWHCRPEHLAAVFPWHCRPTHLAAVLHTGKISFLDTFLSTLSRISVILFDLHHLILIVDEAEACAKSDDAL